MTNKLWLAAATQANWLHHIQVVQVLMRQVKHINHLQVCILRVVTHPSSLPPSLSVYFAAGFYPQAVQTGAPCPHLAGMKGVKGHHCLWSFLNPPRIRNVLIAIEWSQCSYILVFRQGQNVIS